MTFGPRSDAHAASQPKSGRGLARSAAGARSVLAIFLLFCLLVQGTIVQSHVHLARPAAAAAANRQASVASDKADPAIDCRLCQVAAMAGAYVLPATVVLPPPPAPFSWVAPLATREFGLIVRSHDWRSRAPPQ